MKLHPLYTRSLYRTNLYISTNNMLDNGLVYLYDVSQFDVISTSNTYTHNIQIMN